MLSMFSGRGQGPSAEEEKEFEEDRDRLRDFQFKMMELQVCFQGARGEGGAACFLIAGDLKPSAPHIPARLPRVIVSGFYVRGTAADVDWRGASWFVLSSMRLIS